MERDEALLLASKRRMRPIFMTSIAMVLGMLPLAVKVGGGLGDLHRFGHGRSGRVVSSHIVYIDLHPGCVHHIG